MAGKSQCGATVTRAIASARKHYWARASDPVPFHGLTCSLTTGASQSHPAATFIWSAHTQATRCLNHDSTKATGDCRGNQRVSHAVPVLYDYSDTGHTCLTLLGPNGNVKLDCRVP